MWLVVIIVSLRGKKVRDEHEENGLCNNIVVIDRTTMQQQAKITYRSKTSPTFTVSNPMLTGFAATVWELKEAEVGLDKASLDASCSGGHNAMLTRFVKCEGDNIGASAGGLFWRSSSENEIPVLELKEAEVGLAKAIPVCA